MPVEFWTGGEFRYVHERTAVAQIIKNFYECFDQDTQTVMVVFNVFCNGKEMDLLILKSDSLAVIDLKDCDKPIHASENGQWFIFKRLPNGTTSADGQLHGNPFRQIGDNRYSLMKFLSDHKAEFLRPQKSAHAKFDHINGVVAVSPSLHAESVNTIDKHHRWFYLTGVDQLHDLVARLTSKTFSFSDEELTTLIANVFKCERLAIEDGYLAQLLVRPVPEPRKLEPAFGETKSSIRKHIRDFAPFVEDKCRGFVGRAFMFDQIDSFLKDAPRGYFVIYGDPGIGKSALAAQLVAMRRYLHHFNIESEGINRRDIFLSNLCAQLIARHHLAADTVPMERMTDGGFLTELLREATASRPSDQKIIIVVDALDEVDRSGSSLAVNPLCLPKEPPPGVYFIVTARRGFAMPRIDCEHRVTEIIHDSADNLNDITDYLANQVIRPGIMSYLLEHHLKQEQFIDMLVERSEGNFIYLRHVLPEIESGAYRDLSWNTLPSGLRNYYDDHWQRMRSGDVQDWFDYKLPILAALTSIMEPVSLELLIEFSGITDRSRLRATLTEWRQFLHQSQVDVGEERPEIRWRIYHTSYHDFLASKEDVEAERFDLRAARKRIADSLLKGLYE